MSGDEAELSPAPGFVAREVQNEFPGLRLAWVTVAGGPRVSSPAVVKRLHTLSSRARGASVVTMRTQPVPQAYRTFFRQIGLDPDVERVPSEEAAVNRLMHGGYRPRGSVEDALLLALIETGVPIWALDADFVDVGGPGIRLAAADEWLGTGETSVPLREGSLVVADATTVQAVLFGPVAPGHEVRQTTSRMTLFAVGVEGVPAIHVEEALWLCAEALTGW